MAVQVVISVRDGSIEIAAGTIAIPTGTPQRPTFEISNASRYQFVSVDDSPAVDLCRFSSAKSRITLWRPDLDRPFVDGHFVNVRAECIDGEKRFRTGDDRGMASVETKGPAVAFQYADQYLTREKLRHSLPIIVAVVIVEYRADAKRGRAIDCDHVAVSESHFRPASSARLHLITRKQRQIHTCGDLCAVIGSPNHSASIVKSEIRLVTLCCGRCGGDQHDKKRRDENVAHGNLPVCTRRDWPLRAACHWCFLFISNKIQQL